MNLRYDNTVHAENGMLPICGNSEMPVMLPEITTDPVNCRDCLAIIG